LADAVVVQLAVLQGDEDDPLELAGRAVIGGADGERGLSHAARAVDERAPRARLRVECLSNRGELALATEEGLEAWEVVGSRGVETPAAGGVALLVLRGTTLIPHKAFENQVDGLAWSRIVEVDVPGEPTKPSSLDPLEAGEHDLIGLARLEKAKD